MSVQCYVTPHGRIACKAADDAGDGAPMLTDEAAEAVIRKLLDLDYSAVATIEHEVSGRMATVRLTRRGDDDGVVTDLLFA